MMISPPTLRQWHGTNQPEIRTVESLKRSIRIDRYQRVYWIAKLIDNVVIEAHSLDSWYFATDGRLIGIVDTDGIKQPKVDINPDEFVILSVV